jgi:DivIVA domain-containing protein
VTEYAKSRVTDVNDLTLGCGGHHPIVKPGGWQTRTRKDGRSELIPPPHLDRGQPRINLFHHPENSCAPARKTTMTTSSLRVTGSEEGVMSPFGKKKRPSQETMHGYEPSPIEQVHGQAAAGVVPPHGSLTADDVRDAAFRKPPTGERGYNEDDVDEFLDRVEAQLRSK